MHPFREVLTLAKIFPDEWAELMIDGGLQWMPEKSAALEQQLHALRTVGGGLGRNSADGLYFIGAAQS